MFSPKCSELMDLWTNFSFFSESKIYRQSLLKSFKWTSMNKSFINKIKQLSRNIHAGVYFSAVGNNSDIVSFMLVESKPWEKIKQATLSPYDPPPKSVFSKYWKSFLANEPQHPTSHSSLCMEISFSEPHQIKILTRMILWSRIIFLMQFTINAITMTVSMTPNTRTMINMCSDCFSSSYIVVKMEKFAGNCHNRVLSITHRTLFRVLVPAKPAIHVAIAPQLFLDACLIFTIVLVALALACCSGDIRVKIIKMGEIKHRKTPINPERQKIGYPPLVPFSLKAVYKIANDELIATVSAKYRICITFVFDWTESAIEPQKFLILGMEEKRKKNIHFKQISVRLSWKLAIWGVEEVIRECGYSDNKNTSSNKLLFAPFFMALINKGSKGSCIKHKCEENCFEFLLPLPRLRSRFLHTREERIIFAWRVDKKVVGV